MTNATRPADPNAETISVRSHLFGSLVVPVDSAVVFPEGLLGFEGPQRFVLLPAQEGIFWLLDVDRETAAFLVIDPYAFVPDYSFAFTSSERLVTGLDDSEDVAVLAIVTLTRAPKTECTANLQGPLLIDFRTRRGWQVIQPDGPYGTRERVELRGRAGAVSSSS